MSLMLPCHSDFDLLAEPAAVDMHVNRNLCGAMHLSAWLHCIKHFACFQAMLLVPWAFQGYP